MGIIPAYAGSTVGDWLLQSQRGDHPRIRGEHLAVDVDGGGFGGSSPHTRGALTLSWVHWSPLRDHPRIRGEHGRTAGRVAPPHSSSPHTRGARRPRGRCSGSRGIIPAYAGSTPGPRPSAPPPPDHPRIRGEHLLCTVGAAAEGGSSPHTRGAPWASAARRAVRGIIPAYAGSTTTLISTWTG